MNRDKIAALKLNQLAGKPIAEVEIWNAALEAVLALGDDVNQSVREECELARMILKIDAAARSEGLYIGGGRNLRLSEDEQEGPMWKAIKKKANSMTNTKGQ